jgi:hypothetical protein
MDRATQALASWTPSISAVHCSMFSFLVGLFTRSFKGVQALTAMYATGKDKNGLGGILDHITDTPGKSVRCPTAIFYARYMPAARPS